MKNKTTWIVVGIVLAIILLIGGLFISSNNKAIFLEEQINAAQADINVAEKRRYDLVFNLVDAVQSYQDYEGETMESIVSARNSMEHGDVEGAQMEITAVADAYPELKANENYKQLMNELALTENQIAQYRNNIATYANIHNGSPELYEAAVLHDIGKAFTKAFKNSRGEDTDIAHYYEHHHVSAYDSLFYTQPALDVLYVAGVIQWHMRPFELERVSHAEKAAAKFKRLIGDKMYADVMALHEADIKAKMAPAEETK